jgi:hypothetical protein
VEPFELPGTRTVAVLLGDDELRFSKRSGADGAVVGLVGGPHDLGSGFVGGIVNQCSET